jgi:hypothetical protein
MTGGGKVEGGPLDVLKEVDLENPDVRAGRNNHLGNWLDCIGTRQRPSCPEELGHRTASLGHLPNIAFWTGRSLKWDPVKEEFPGDDTANRLRSRTMRAPWRI